MCLFSSYIYSQTSKTIREESNADGNYTFHKATATAYKNNNTEVFSHVFNDTISLKELQKLPFPIQPVLLSAQIQKGRLVGCKLWNNNKEYYVVNEGMLLVPAKETEPDTNDAFSIPYQLSPLYTLKTEGDTVICTFTEPYGNSSFDFTLKGELVIVLVKDKF